MSCGHMSTNLAECMNNVLKWMRKLPISSLVQPSYHGCAKFVERGRNDQEMMVSGLIYSNKVIKNIDNERRILNSHEVLIHNFRVKKLVHPPNSRSVGTFKVNLDKQWCDYGELQALH